MRYLIVIGCLAILWIMTFRFVRHIARAAELRERSRDMHVSAAKYLIRNRNRNTEVPKED